MKKLQLLAMGILISAGATVNASFEMMMFVEGNKINRYDPENRVALGSFGEGELGMFLNPVIAADPTNQGVVAVLNGDGGIRRFNAYTGRYLGAVHTGVDPWFGNGPMRLEVLNNGNYLVTGWAGVGTATQVSRIYSSTNGALLSDMLPFGSGYMSLDSVQGADGNIYSLNRFSSNGTSNFYSFVYTSTGSLLGVNQLAIGAAATRFGAIGRSGNKILITGHNHYEAIYHSLGITQPVNPVLWGFFNGGTFTGDIAQAHSRTYMHAWSNNAGTYTNRLNYFDPVTNYVSNNTFALPYTNALGSMTIITAPEPGTLAALAAGAGWLLRRKKRRDR